MLYKQTTHVRIKRREERKKLKRKKERKKCASSWLKEKKNKKVQYFHKKKAKIKRGEKKRFSCVKKIVSSYPLSNVPLALQ